MVLVDLLLFCLEAMQLDLKFALMLAAQVTEFLAMFKPDLLHLVLKLLNFTLQLFDHSFLFVFQRMGLVC